MLAGAILAFAILAWEKASGLSAEEKTLPVIGGFMGLVMEGMRRVDEQEV